MMSKIYCLPQKEQELFFRAAADIMNIPFEIIEKDYWVVWILDRLFSIKEIKNHLTFKGGTSLSKVYQVIHRFSEDIDLSIEKEFLGYGIPNDPESADSKKKQSKILKDLSKSCAKYVQTQLLNSLSENITLKIGTTDGWALFSDQDDPSGQTLLFQYPSRFSKTGYIRPQVKIEMGARSEHWPVEEYHLQSYAKEALKEKLVEAKVLVRVLGVERTFWEKATILHQYAHLPEDKKLPPRISRHYYDLFCLLNSDVKLKALKEASLLERVASHKNLYFSSSWANYNIAHKGTLKLIPSNPTLQELEKDYARMKAMFFRETPEWKIIISTISEFEKEFNRPSV